MHKLIISKMLEMVRIALLLAVLPLISRIVQQRVMDIGV